MDALGLDLGQDFSEGAEGFRMGVADGDGFALFFCAVHGEFELLANRGDILNIIEEGNVAKSAADVILFSGVEGHSGGGGAAVDGKEIALAEKRH